MIGIEGKRANVVYRAPPPRCVPERTRNGDKVRVVERIHSVVARPLAWL